MKKELRILLVEDDKFFRADIAAKLRPYGQVAVAGDFEHARDILASTSFQVALIDLNLPGTGSGLDVIQEAVKAGVVPIVLTGDTSPEKIARAYELGCKHYFSKLEVQADLDRQLGFYLKSLSQDDLTDLFAKEFVTEDPRLLLMLQQLRSRNLHRDQRILLLGPTGVGKTKIAKIIHRMCESNLDNLVHLNVAEIPENLLESILFGHKKGAFTGATEDKDGFLKKAHGGTLFLDEIGTLSLALQKKLLKVLEEKTFTPVGSTVTLHSDFRLIAATCEDLPKLIEAKKFRLDLYFRLKGLEITIPALKERRGDIPKLVNFFASQGARRIAFAEDAMLALSNYDWHGNVRELEQEVRTLASGQLGLVRLQDLPEHIRENRNPYPVEEEQKIYTRNISQFVQKHGLRKFIQLVEREAFSEIYHRTAGNLTKTQLTLGISKSATYRILESVRGGGANVGANVGAGMAEGIRSGVTAGSGRNGVEEERGDA